MGDLGFLLSGCSPSEHTARLRELRALALVYLGPAHPATTALAAAVADPAMTERALGLVGDLPALRKRRLLATYAAIMGGRSKLREQQTSVRR
jgi:hypothetical protein